MFSDIQDYLRYYRGLNKRTMRDIAALPPEAETYVPPAVMAERAGDEGVVWSIGDLVRHIAGARLYFARAYRNEGWIFDEVGMRETRATHGANRATRGPVASRRKIDSVTAKRAALRLVVSARGRPPYQD